MKRVKHQYLCLKFKLYACPTEIQALRMPTNRMPTIFVDKEMLNLSVSFENHCYVMTHPYPQSTAPFGRQPVRVAGKRIERNMPGYKM